MVTLKQIAAEAEVSTTTVSNVLHGNTKRVSPQMVKKVQGLLTKNNYIPRFGLSALTNRGSKMIGVLINTPPFVENTPYERPFYGNTIGTLENLLRKRGYYIMIFSSKNIQEIMTMTLGWNVDGVIAISMPKKYYQQIGKRTDKPIVSIDMEEFDDAVVSDCYNITSKDREGGRMMIEHLLGRGIKKVIYLANTRKGADYIRYSGAERAYRERLGDDNELELWILSKTYEERVKQYKTLRKFLGRNIALFFSTDLNAAEAIGYFERRQIKVPEEISIVGFDDDIYARLSTPRITTMRIDAPKKAEWAVNMLLSLIDGESIEEKNREIEVQLIERESVCKQEEW